MCVQVTMSSLVNALESAGQWQLAIEKFDELRACGVQPNAICYNAAVSALAKGAQADAAKALVATMRAEGHTPDIYTFAPLVGALGSAGLVDEAMQVCTCTHRMPL
jgi:pentatricopeptide repeat protein